jgi:hypothetical protein
MLVSAAAVRLDLDALCADGGLEVDPPESAEDPSASIVRGIGLHDGLVLAVGEFRARERDAAPQRDDRDAALPRRSRG